MACSSAALPSGLSQCQLLTSRLSGATPAQLAHWRRSGLLVPEVKPRRRPLLYSFRDIVALRSFARLREKISLQKVRRALQSMHGMDMYDHPSLYTLTTDGNTIIVQKATDKPVDLVSNPGQEWAINFEDVFAEFTNLRGDAVVNLRRPHEFIEIEPQRLGGWPTIEGTRIPFQTIASLISDGSVKPEDASKLYPSVSPAAARSALDFARSLIEPEERRTA